MAPKHSAEKKGSPHESSSYLILDIQKNDCCATIRGGRGVMDLLGIVLVIFCCDIRRRHGFCCDIRLHGGNFYRESREIMGREQDLTKVASLVYRIHLSFNATGIMCLPFPSSNF